MTPDVKYWELIHSNTSDPDCEQFLQLLSCISRWSGPELPDKVGTVRLRQAVTLAPQGEYLVWGKLPSSTPVSLEALSLWSPPLPVQPQKISLLDGLWHPRGEIIGSR